MIAFVALGNLAVLSASVWAQEATPNQDASPAAAGIENFRVVDPRLWRGGAPSEADYRALRAAGVRTVVDLRAEVAVGDRRALLRDLGLRLVRIPVRDGQAPAPSQVQRFLNVVDRSEGKVYVHCMAGVGRTGTMVAAYLVRRDGADPIEALEHNLSVGPPSLEQIAFVTELESFEIQRPPIWVTALSRVLDAPRRSWVHLRHLGMDTYSLAMLVMATTFAWMLSRVESTRQPRNLLRA